MLSVRDIAMRFGGIIALDGVSFDVFPRQICGLIGPNGSGKTTLFNCISGFYRPKGGSITMLGRELTTLPRHRIIAQGIGRTFQNVALFPSMTVRDNVLAGIHHLFRSGFAANALRVPAVRREEAEAHARAEHVLHLLDLQSLGDAIAGTLPFGTRKRVEMARALIARPRLLLLDEPACGLNHGEVDDLEDLLRHIRAQFDLSILLVEHHMSLVMRISENVVVLEHGIKIADGPPDEVRNEPEVIRAYLGDTLDAHA